MKRKICLNEARSTVKALTKTKSQIPQAALAESPPGAEKSKKSFDFCRYLTSNSDSDTFRQPHPIRIPTQFHHISFILSCTENFMPSQIHLSFRKPISQHSKQRNYCQHQQTNKSISLSEKTNFIRPKSSRKQSGILPYFSTKKLS